MIHDNEAICRTCGTLFYRAVDERWKRLCLDCWRDTKANDHDSAACEACYQRGIDVGRMAAAQRYKPSIDRTRIRELLQLAHPDKHGNSPLAARVTAWLLEQRGAA